MIALAYIKERAHCSNYIIIDISHFQNAAVRSLRRRVCAKLHVDIEQHQSYELNRAHQCSRVTRDISNFR